VRYFNGSAWTDQNSPPPSQVVARARRRRVSPRARLIIGITLVVIGLASTIFGVVGLTSSQYGQPGAVVCNGHLMRRDEICRYAQGGRSGTHNYVENYNEKLAHQTSSGQHWPPLLLGLGLLWLLLGGLFLWPFYKHRRGRPLQPPQPG
jgi:hypothetical protein